MKLNKRVYLCGFMGSGKSTVGKILSKQLGLPRVDTDYIVARKEGKKVTEIFNDKGEEYFRQKEASLIKNLSYQKPKIVSLGGGTALSAKNEKILKSTGVVVFLNVPFETVYERIRRNNRRPKANECTKEELKQLYEERKVKYRKICDIEMKNSEDILETVERLKALLIENGAIEIE